MAAEIDRIKALAGLIDDDDDDDDLFGSVEEKRSLFEKKPQEQTVPQAQSRRNAPANRSQPQQYLKSRSQSQSQPLQRDKDKKWSSNSHVAHYDPSSNVSRPSVKDMAQTASVIKKYQNGQSHSTEHQNEQHHGQEQQQLVQKQRQQHQQPVNQKLPQSTSSMTNSQPHISDSSSSNQYKQSRKNNLDGFLRAQKNHANVTAAGANNIHGVSAKPTPSNLNTSNNIIASGRGVGGSSSSANLQATAPSPASASTSRSATVGKLSIHQIAHFHPSHDQQNDLGNNGDGTNGNSDEEKDRCIFGKPQTFGAAGGEVETDRIPNVRERALAINQWKIWEKNHKKNGHARAAQWRAGSSSASTCSAATGDGNSLHDEHGQSYHHGHPRFNGGSALYGDDSFSIVSTKSRMSKAPPSFLSQFEQNEEEQSHDGANSAMSLADSTTAATPVATTKATTPNKNPIPNANNVLSSPRNNGGVLTPRNGFNGNATPKINNGTNESNGIKGKKSSLGKGSRPNFLSHFHDDGDAVTSNGPDDELAALATKEESLTSPRVTKPKTPRKEMTTHHRQNPHAGGASTPTSRSVVASTFMIATTPSPRVGNTDVAVINKSGNSSWVLPSPKQSHDKSDEFGFSREKEFGFDIHGKDFSSSKGIDYGFDSNDFSFGFDKENSDSDASILPKQAGGIGTGDDPKESSNLQPKGKDDDLDDLMNEASKYVGTAFETDSDLDKKDDVQPTEKETDNKDDLTDDYWDEELMSAKELAMALDRLLHLNDGDDDEAEREENEKEKEEEDQAADGVEADNSHERNDAVSTNTSAEVSVEENLMKNSFEANNQEVTAKEKSKVTSRLDEDEPNPLSTSDYNVHSSDLSNNRTNITDAWGSLSRESSREWCRKENRECSTTADQYVDKVAFGNFEQNGVKGSPYHLTPPTPNFQDNYFLTMDTSYEDSTRPQQHAEIVESNKDDTYFTYSLDSLDEKLTMTSTKGNDAGSAKNDESKKPSKIKICIDGAPKFQLSEDPNTSKDEDFFYFHQPSPRVGDDACLLASTSPIGGLAKSPSKDLGGSVKTKETPNKFIQTTSVIGRKLDIKGFFHSTMPVKREHHSGEGLLADPHKLTTIDTSAFDSFDIENVYTNNSMTSDYFFARAPSPSNAVVEKCDSASKKKFSQAHLTFGPSAMAAAAAAAGSPFKHDMLSNEMEQEQDEERETRNVASGSFGSSKKKPRKLFRSIKMKGPLGRKRRNHQQHESLNDSYSDLEFC